jgi:hypothetical protein
MSLWLGSLGAGNAPGFFFSFCFAFFLEKKVKRLLTIVAYAAAGCVEE